MKALLPVLCIVLVTLKLTGVVAIPWLWAFAPLWIPIVLFIAVVAAASVFFGALAVFATIVQE